MADQTIYIDQCGTPPEESVLPITVTLANGTTHTISAPYLNSSVLPITINVGGQDVFIDIVDNCSPPAMELNIVVDGNSLATIQGGGISWSQQLTAKLTSNSVVHTMTNKAVGGQTTPQMEADAITDIDPLYTEGKRNVLIFQEGINDMVLNEPTSTGAFDNIKAYCTNRQTSGWEVWIIPILPAWYYGYKGDNTVTGYNLLNTERLDVNNMLALDSSFYDKYLDVSTIPGLYDLGDNEEAGYVFSIVRPIVSENGKYLDGTHLKNLGRDDISDMLLAEFLAV